LLQTCEEGDPTSREWVRSLAGPCGFCDWH